MCGDPSCTADDSASVDAVLSDGDERSLDRLLETIADRRCRYVLAYFDSASVEVVDLDDLVDRVAEREAEEGTLGADVDGEEHRRRVAVALHHSKLPRLADESFLEYDSRSKTVRYRGGDGVGACLDLYRTASEQ